LRKVALLLASVVVSLLFAEVLLRVTHAAPEVQVIQKGRFRLSKNPKIGFEPVPGLEYHGKERSFYDYEGASNSLGYRDREHAIAKPAGVYRIVVIGDSVGAGLKVEKTEDTFAPQLEQLLTARGLKNEVINLSVSGYNTQQEVETLHDHGLQYAPDLVIVAYTLGDRERLDGGIMETLLAEEREHGGRSTARANPWLLHSALYRFFRFRVLVPASERQTAAPATTATPAVPAAGAPASDPYLDLVSGDTVDEYFGVLRDLSRQHHFDVMIAVFPYFVKSFGYYKHADQHAWVGEEARQHGFHLLDLLSPMARCRDAAAPVSINVDNYHPNERGHRCAAEAMAQQILAEIHPH
jgi:lysophospholipase L1-like esterase